LPNFQIKRVVLADADLLLSLSKKTFFDAFSKWNNATDMALYSAIAFTPEKTIEELNNPDSEFYFAMDGDTAVGYIKLNFNDAQTEFKGTNALEIERIYVLTDYHGKHIGSNLLNFAIETASNKNFEYVWLGVWEHNYNAIGFYEHNGFKLFGSHEFLLGNDLQMDVLMKKIL
jgi:ribosomal protein S18 acetylase RimI-like enzyme